MKGLDTCSIRANGYFGAVDKGFSADKEKGPTDCVGGP
jgi:hypothetical protein